MHLYTTTVLFSVLAPCHHRLLNVWTCPCLQEATLQSLAEEAADPQHTAHQQQGCAVLREILTRAFAEADPQNTGLVRPGQGLMQLLFAAAAQLTSVMVGATPLLSHEATGAWVRHTGQAERSGLLVADCVCLALVNTTMVAPTLFCLRTP